MEAAKRFETIFISEKDTFPDIIGQKSVKNQLKSALLTNRHIIILGPPGIGKTTLGRNVAKLLDKAKFVRIQGSPDLTVEDLLGDIDPVKALKFGPLDKKSFTPGKIFKANNGILFFDEINRCPEKLQNALLQVLEERKATIAGYDVDFPSDFIFIGTMNPEDTSTEKLSAVFIDRFDIIYMGYPETPEIENEIVLKKGKNLNVEFPKNLLDFCIQFVRLLRENDELEEKPSVRASLGLYERAQANAYLKKRKRVSFQDIEEAVISVISHRIKLKPSVKYLKKPSDFVEEEFRKFSDEFSDKFKTEQKGGYL